MASTYQYPPLVAQVAAGGAVAALGPEPGDAQIRHRHHQPAQILHLQPSVETQDVDGLQVDAPPFIYTLAYQGRIKSLKNLLEFGCVQPGDDRDGRRRDARDRQRMQVELERICCASGAGGSGAP